MFSVTSTAAGPVAVIAVTGELDLATAPQLAEALQPHQRGDCPRIVLDFSQLTFLDCTGLGVLVSARAYIPARVDIVIAAGPPMVQRLLDLTGLHDVFPTFPDLQAAAGIRGQTG